MRICRVLSSLLALYGLLEDDVWGVERSDCVLNPLYCVTHWPDALGG
uniref:Uncharacterized protein n=1 Tax=Arundo donax TaxID=35708 RepID=A0A0A8Y8Z3_ARUDO